MKSIRILLAVLFAFFTVTLWAQKPNVYVLATGGTIAGSGTSSVSTNYTAGQVAIGALLDAVPQIKDIANVVGEQIVRIGSQDMDDATWLLLAKRINELQASDSVDAVVVTHGTDTMEETAFFLNLTVAGTKPVVLVGAMRPSTALSADGPLNLYNAVVTAISPASVGKGVLVVMNGRIYGADGVVKMHTTDVDAFGAPNSGALGYVLNGRAVYETSPKRPGGRPMFDVSHLDALPKVGIAYGHAGVSPDIIESMIKNHYRGIVYAGVGNGNIHKNLFAALEEARRKGIIVVRSSRIVSGPTSLDNEVDDERYQFVASQLLGPSKARVLLMLALTQTDDWRKIQSYFNLF